MNTTDKEKIEYLAEFMSAIMKKMLMFQDITSVTVFIDGCTNTMRISGYRNEEEMMSSTVHEGKEE